MSIKMRNRSYFFPHCHLFSCVLRASYHWWTFFCRCFDFDSRELASEWLPEPNTQELSLSRFAQKLNSNKRYLVRRRRIYEKLHVLGLMAHISTRCWMELDSVWTACMVGSTQRRLIRVLQTLRRGKRREEITKAWIRTSENIKNFIFHCSVYYSFSCTHAFFLYWFMRALFAPIWNIHWTSRRRLLYLWRGVFVQYQRKDCWLKASTSARPKCILVILCDISGIEKINKLSQWQRAQPPSSTCLTIAIFSLFLCSMFSDFFYLFKQTRWARESTDLWPYVIVDDRLNSAPPFVSSTFDSALCFDSRSQPNNQSQTAYIKREHIVQHPSVWGGKENLPMQFRWKRKS